MRESLEQKLYACIGPLINILEELSALAYHIEHRHADEVIQDSVLKLVSLAGGIGYAPVSRVLCLLKDIRDAREADTLPVSKKICRYCADRTH